MAEISLYLFQKTQQGYRHLYCYAYEAAYLAAKCFHAFGEMLAQSKKGSDLPQALECFSISDQMHRSFFEWLSTTHLEDEPLSFFGQSIPRGQMQIMIVQSRQTTYSSRCDVKEYLTEMGRKTVGEQSKPSIHPAAGQGAHVMAPHATSAVASDALQARTGDATAVEL